jgi:preprotein translocase subunit Sss1
MAKTLCKILGIVLAVVGIAGFLKHDLFGAHLTTIHNIVHLLTAAIALYFGFYGSDAAARTFCQVFGAIYLLLGIVGFIAPNVVANIIQSHTATGGENLTPDNIIHLLLGAVFLIGGLLRAPQPAAT